MRIAHKNYLSTIGNTPLVALSRVGEEGLARVWVKVEGLNATGSIKSRVARSLVQDSLETGKLKMGMGIVEPTCGNLGIALAMVASSLGIELTLVMPNSVPATRIRTIERFGANIEFTHASRGMHGAVLRAKQLVAQEPERLILLNQFENAANAKAHYDSTGPEIWGQSGGAIDVLVCGIGTGGTLCGAGRYLKERKNVTLVGVEPSRSPVLTQHKQGLPLTPGAHGIQGIGAGFVPPQLNLDLIDRIETVEDAEAFVVMNRLAREEGMCVGPSCGAAAAVALRLSRLPEFSGKTIVVILPESYEHRI